MGFLVTLHYGIKYRVRVGQWVIGLFQRRSFYYVLVFSFIFGLVWGIGYRAFLNKPGLAPFGAKKVIRVLALENTFPQDVIEGFQTYSKVEVRLLPQVSPEALVQAAFEKPFDVIVFKSYVARSLLENRLVGVIDKTQIKNWSLISRDFLGLSYDPENNFFVPFGWGVMGFLYPTEKWQSEPKTLKDFLNPLLETKVYLSKRDEDLLFLAERKLNLQKYSDARLKQLVQTEFERLKKVAREPAFIDQKLTPSPDEKDSALAYFLSHGEAQSLIKENKSLRFVIPSDGALLWTSNFAISATSSNSGLAYEFIDYLLSPEVAPDLARLRGLATTTQTSSGLPDHLQADYLKKLNLHSLTLARGRVSN